MAPRYSSPSIMSNPALLAEIIKLKREQHKNLHRVVFEQEPGYPGVYGAVADDEDVKEGLP